MVWFFCAHCICLWRGGGFLVPACRLFYRLTPTPLHCINRSFAALNHDFYDGEGRNPIFAEDRKCPSPQIFRQENSWRGVGVRRSKKRQRRYKNPSPRSRSKRRTFTHPYSTTMIHHQAQIKIHNQIQSELPKPLKHQPVQTRFIASHNRTIPRNNQAPLGSPMTNSRPLQHKKTH